MCERSTLAFLADDRDIAANPRRVALYRWVADDLAAGDRKLSRALALWRDECIQRLPGHRSMKIRIPWIFVGALQLADQRVFLCEDNAICLINRDARNRSIPGRLLVPGQKNRPM